MIELMRRAIPAEIAVHPYKRNNVHTLYLMCDEVQAFMTEMKLLGITCEDVVQAEWGLLTNITLPGDGKLGGYQPRHARPESGVA